MFALFGSNHRHSKLHHENSQSFRSGGIFASMFTKGQHRGHGDHWAWRLTGNYCIPTSLVVDRGVSYVGGCSALDFLFIHDAWPHALPQNKPSNINKLNSSPSIRRTLTFSCCRSLYSCSF